MSTSDPSNRSNWQRRDRPLRLERRLEFPDYQATRAFLESAGALSDETGIYPNLSFGRSYVNLTLFADENSNELTPALLAFSERLDAILDADESKDEP